MDLYEFIKDINQRKDLGAISHLENIPERPAILAPPGFPMDRALSDAYNELGIKSIYQHQAEGIELIRSGRNVVIMTPASSGKSLIYNTPVIEGLLKGEPDNALYLFPLKGLEQDQLKTLNNLNEILVKNGCFSNENRALCAIYDGDTTAYRRKKIREAPPAILLTNPDMLHLSILALHKKWERFLSRLKYVIIDEVHTYRGVFGSHVANIIKRLKRIAGYYKTNLQFIACSATIANPKELAEMLTGSEFELISRDSSPQGKRVFIFLSPNPKISPYTVATNLFISSIRAGLKTIAFTKARRITELMHAWVAEKAPDTAGRISSYRSGFLPDERRLIEKRLFNNELSGVISTSALELGVDIGGLDVCILVGYPGTISSTWQMAGRAGRRGRDALILLIPLQDALDQHFIRNPVEFFRRTSEAAVLDSSNPYILKPHLLCAAAELRVSESEPFYDAAKFRPILDELEREEQLRFWHKGGIWYPRVKYPHRGVSIRGTGDSYVIKDKNRRLIGQSSSGRVFFEHHPGAIYMHRAMLWKVIRLDTEQREITCVEANDSPYYTRAASNEHTEIISEDFAKPAGSINVHFGGLRATETVIGYRKKLIHSDQDLGEFPLDLPPAVFETKGIWFQVSQSTLQSVKDLGFSPAGSLHALEHAMIATLPFFALCDRMDIGGVSYEYNHELKSPAIFIYDGSAGGIGLAKRGYDLIDEWFSSALKLMEDCACEVSCPSCTQDPKCGNNNDPLDKRGAIFIIQQALR